MLLLMKDVKLMHNNANCLQLQKRVLGNVLLYGICKFVKDREMLFDGWNWAGIGLWIKQQLSSSGTHLQKNNFSSVLYNLHMQIYFSTLFNLIQCSVALLYVMRVVNIKQYVIIWWLHHSIHN